jgi:hypothetical protein
MGGLWRNRESLRNRTHRRDQGLQTRVGDKAPTANLKQIIRRRITSNSTPRIPKRLHNDRTRATTVLKRITIHDISLPDFTPVKIVHTDIASPPMVLAFIQNQRHIWIIVPV